MFTRNFLMAVLGLALLLAIPGYVKAQTSGKDVTPSQSQPATQAKKAEPATKSLKSYTPAERQAYQKKASQDLDQIQQNIYDLELKSRTVEQQKKRMVLRALLDLQRRYIYAKQKLTALKAAPEKNWSSLKAEMDKSMANLTQAIDALEGHI